MKPPIREDFAPLKGKGSTRRLYAPGPRDQVNHFDPLKGKGSTRRLYARFGVATFFPLPLRAEMIRARWAQAWQARNTK